MLWAETPVQNLDVTVLRKHSPVEDGGEPDGRRDSAIAERVGSHGGTAILSGAVYKGCPPLSGKSDRNPY